MRPSLALLTTILLTLVAPAAAGAAAVSGVTLDWTGNGEVQAKARNGAANYFTAGATDGSAGAYSARSGNVQIVQAPASGAEYQATWATRAAHVNGAGRQVARLFGGHGTVAGDGSATIAWSGAFTLNFYGGLLPFTIGDPVLEVDATGHGTLKADLSGYGSSQANPDVKTPLTPAPGVTIATLSGAVVQPGQDVALTPDYAGVAVTLPGGFTPQNRAIDGWGAWPQGFVDFQLGTGLSSYWYSSGDSDTLKPPFPFRLRFGPVAVVDPPPASGTETKPTNPPAQGPDTPANDPDAPVRKAPGLRITRAAGGAVTIARTRRATIATLSCPRGPRCTVRIPARARIRIAGRAYTVMLSAPRRIASGRRAAVRIRISKPAAKRLAGRRAKLSVPVKLTAGSVTKTATVLVTLRGRR